MRCVSFVLFDGACVSHCLCVWVGVGSCVCLLAVFDVWLFVVVCLFVLRLFHVVVCFINGWLLFVSLCVVVGYRVFFVWLLCLLCLSVLSLWGFVLRVFVC